ncbi:hypothetical protein CERSUDRAFT_24966, partial [Gelatoporia subvermispora B]
YLDKLIRLDGQVGFDEELCPLCENGAAEIRCNECQSGELLCTECIKHRHEYLPLHGLQRWNGRYFERLSLHELSLVVQLGHRPRSSCLASTPRNMTIVHVNGIHRVKARFCECDVSVERWQQCIRMGWWPATVLEPETCFTLALMRLFHTLNLQGNITAYDFYRTLEGLTD